MTKRPYRQGRTERAPEARLTPDERDRLIMILDKDGLSMADWVMKHVKGDEEMESINIALIQIVPSKFFTDYLSPFEHFEYDKRDHTWRTVDEWQPGEDAVDAQVAACNWLNENVGDTTE